MSPLRVVIDGAFQHGPPDRSSSSRSRRETSSGKVVEVHGFAAEHGEHARDALGEDACDERIGDSTFGQQVAAKGEAVGVRGGFVDCAVLIDNVMVAEGYGAAQVGFEDVPPSSECRRARIDRPSLRVEKYLPEHLR